MAASNRIQITSPPGMLEVVWAQCRIGLQIKVHIGRTTPQMGTTLLDRLAGELREGAMKTHWWKLVLLSISTCLSQQAHTYALLTEVLKCYINGVDCGPYNNKLVFTGCLCLARGRLCNAHVTAQATVYSSTQSTEKPVGLEYFHGFSVCSPQPLDW